MSFEGQVRQLVTNGHSGRGPLSGLAIMLVLLAFAVGSEAQPAAPAELTLSQAVERASQNYPAIRVSQEQMNAAAAGIRLARTAYLPRVDALAQVNRATRNNVFGLRSEERRVGKECR